MKWEAYKKNKGKLIRWIVFSCISVLLLFGMYRLYYTIPTDKTWEWAWKPILVGDNPCQFTIPYVDIEIVLSIRLLFCVLGSLLLLAITYWLIFVFKKFAEFLIETDSEMRKVYWPSFKEVLGSSIVIVITIITLGLYLFGVDIILGKVLEVIF